jgi:hypothetical protein
LTFLRTVLEHILVLFNFYIFFFCPTVTFCCVFSMENNETQISYEKTSYISIVTNDQMKNHSTPVCLSNNRTKCWERNEYTQFYLFVLLVIIKF